MFAEGDFLYVDENHSQYLMAINKLIEVVSQLKEKEEATTVIFRDFFEHSPVVKILEENGYVKFGMPNINIVQNPKWNNIDELMSLIDSKKKRDNIKQYAVRHLDKFEIKNFKEITEDQSNIYYELFMNVKKANYSFNFFDYPKKIISILSKYKNWEFTEIRIKETNEIGAVIMGFVGENHYTPFIVGLDYKFINSHHIYKQTMFQMVKRGNDLGKKIVYLGLTADFEKQKYLAVSHKINAYIKYDDTFNLEVIESYSNIYK
jgi:hypothetical protein